MALSGNLREFSLSEILQLLSSQRKTGALRMTRGQESRVVHLLEGRIAGTRDRGFGEDDPLVRFLRRIHRLSEEQLKGIASIHAAMSGRWAWFSTKCWRAVVPSSAALRTKRWS